MKRKGQIIVGLALILIFILMALAAPLLAPNDPNATDLALKNAPPSAEYPLGCDQMGRCELSRLLYGARYSMGLTIPVLIVLAAFALFVGCYSSYKGGLLDEVMRILCDILMAFPLIVIAMALVSAVDNSVASVITAMWSRRCMALTWITPIKSWMRPASQGVRTDSAIYHQV